jgi:hypothetical protein
MADLAHGLLTHYDYQLRSKTSCIWVILSCSGPIIAFEGGHHCSFYPVLGPLLHLKGGAIVQVNRCPVPVPESDSTVWCENNRILRL